jgi:hypothetical protein
MRRLRGAMKPLVLVLAVLVVGSMVLSLAA